MPTQSIIVYRNPLEAAFWESGLLLPASVFVLSFLIVLLVGMKIQDAVFRSAKWPRFGAAYNYSGYGVIAVSLVAAFFAMVKVVA